MTRNERVILRIRLLNDQLRAFPFPPRGEMVLTRGVASLPADDLSEVLHQARTFQCLQLGQRSARRA
jgi:hypothetical protein